MKQNSIIYATLAFALMTVGFSSCESYLDVSPKTQIEIDDHFSRESGFNDQLIGVYTKMASTALYKTNLGIGFAEVLSQNYSINSNSTLWKYVVDYDYTNASVEAVINVIWNEMYSCIANLNVIIQNIDESKDIFTGDNYNLYKGEALGLRAFLHLELMRLFACAPSMDNSAKGVPYATRYGTDIPQQASVGETMTLIVNDLLAARAAFGETDKYDYADRNTRGRRFNYYATTLTLARAYLWMGDKANAQQYAGELIGYFEGEDTPKPAAWVHYTTMEQSQKNAIDYAYSCEHIFQIPFNDWDEISDMYFKKESGANALSPSDDKAAEIYERDFGMGNDYRFSKNFEQDGESKYLSKYWYRDGGPYNGLYPLLRMSEAYYISAECLAETDRDSALVLLEEVRAARNLSLVPLDKDISSADLIEEIGKEYRKEFMAEGGQYFFYCKRRNLPTIKGAPRPATRALYVLPIPATDKEFGGYTN
ncbi:MAG: RagB/SusD family nutrient uptake outer membrane protein [Bacteroidales bacterium]|nr:RagB/SusD family nutrient uptake outer membrane protein [Bacteroidales bacterium]